jgi:hypothetical protein
MKRHRFDPFSFVFGALFLIVGATFMVGGVGIDAVRPVHLWPATIVVIGSSLAIWAVTRAIRAEPAPAGAVAGSEAQIGGRSEHVPAESPDEHAPALKDGAGDGGDGGGDHDDE